MLRHPGKPTSSRSEDLFTQPRQIVALQEADSRPLFPTDFRIQQIPASYGTSPLGEAAALGCLLLKPFPAEPQATSLLQGSLCQQLCTMQSEGIALTLKRNFIILATPGRLQAVFAKKKHKHTFQPHQNKLS